MAKVALVQGSFDRMMRDLPRDRLPKGTCWNILDYIPNELGAPLAKRGGWTYASQALTVVQSGADYTQGVIAAPFTAGEQIVAMSRNAGTNTRVAQIVSSSSTTDRGALADDDLGQPPIFYRQNVYFVLASGAYAPYIYGGSSNATLLTVSPPAASRATVYKDRLVLARSSAEPQRIYFSGPGSPTSWDTTYGYVNSSGTVHALYSLRNAILIFHTTAMERLIGSTPPPGGDMSLQPLFDVGSTYPFSLAGSDEFVCFCNQSGVHMTDGSAIIDLTEQGGMVSYWRSLFGGGRHVAGGYVRGYYVVSVWDASGGSFVDAFLIHLRTRRFTRLSNISAYCFSIAASAADELYWGSREEARVNTVTTMFSPSAATKADADSGAITPVVELPYTTLAQAKARIDQLYLRYDLRDAASDNPVLTMSYVLDPTSTTYTDVLGEDGAAYTLPETTEITRVRRNVRQRAFGVAVKLTQTNASSQTYINSFEVESRPREESAV